jgi:hypothetical protein
MPTPAEARSRPNEIELRTRRNEWRSESKRMERLRIKLKQLQQLQTQLTGAS